MGGVLRAGIGPGGDLRVVALPLLAAVALALLACTPRSLQRRLAVTAVSLASALTLFGAYYAIQERAVGHTGLSPNGIWNLYGRVAPFADCSKFKPPPGTEPLCEKTRARSGHAPPDFYQRPEQDSTAAYCSGVSRPIRADAPPGHGAPTVLAPGGVREVEVGEALARLQRSGARAKLTENARHQMTTVV